MTTDDLSRALEAIARLPEAEFVGPQPEGVVSRAEQALALSFPLTYRRFVLELGAGGIRGCELYGVVSGAFESSPVPNAIWMTLRERSEAGLPNSLILIGDSGYGSYYAIDTTKSRAGSEFAVIEWQPSDPSRTDKVIAEDFGAFLWEIVEWAQKQ